MKIFTTRFGEIEINEDEIIKFPDGVLGFEEITDYIIFEMEEGSPLFWLQAVNEPALAFVLIRPFEFKPNYSLDLSDNDTKALKLGKPEDCDIFAIVVIPEDPQKMTANLQGPIAINTSEKVARQVISTNPRHKIKHMVLEEMQRNQMSQSKGGR